MVEGGLVKYERRDNGNLWYYYDASGSPVGMALGSTVRKYFYRKDLRGDITGIVSGDTGELLVSYRYDAWGKPEITVEAGTSESAELIERNCLLYRGYFYDHETGLYYLQSRYYDPEVGRFINADTIVNTGKHILGNNIFAYCYNNPNLYKDDQGSDAILLLDEKSVGHIGALIQDADGTWWHFYWGAKDALKNTLFGLLFLDVPLNTWCVPYKGEISIDAINNSKQYSGQYSEMLIIPGDFSKAISIVESTSEQYSLLRNNCAQKTLEILAQSNPLYHDSFITIKDTYILPAKVYAAAKRIVYQTMLNNAVQRMIERLEY